MQKSKLFILIFSLAVFSLFIISFIRADIISDVIQDLTGGKQAIPDQPFIYPDANSEIYKDAGGFRKVIYSGIVNREVNGKFVPIEDTFNISQKGENLEIKDIFGEECQIIPLYDLKTKTDIAKTTINISKQRGSWYFVSNVDKKVNSVSWIVNCSKAVSYNTLTDDLILPNNLMVDFSQAKSAQNISTTFNETTKQLEFKPLIDKATGLEKPADIAVIDPTVTINTTIVVADCYVDSANPTNSFCSQTSNLVGNDTTSRYRTFIQFNFSSFPSQRDIVSASLWGYWGGFYGTNINLSVYRLTSSFTAPTWNVQPTNSSKIGNLSNYNPVGEWKSISIDNQTVQYMINNSYPNYGFLIASGENIKSAKSIGDSSSANKPYFKITYGDIIINSPSNNQEVLNTLSTTLNTSQRIFNNTIWYTWNNGIKNTTLCTQSQECQTTITFPRQGYYNLSVYANKSDGTTTSQTASNLFVGNSTIQEISNATIGSLILNDFDPLDCSGTWSGFYPVANLYDGNWNTYAQGSTSYACSSSNYTLRANVDKTHTLWQVKDSNGGQQNLTIPSECWGTNQNLSFLIASKDYFGGNTKAWGCYNYSRDHYDILSSTGGGAGGVYEEQIIWRTLSQNTAPTITNTLTNNSNFSVSTINFTFNISDDNDYISNITLFIDGNSNVSLLNQPITANTNNTLNFSVISIPDGNHTWYIQAYDSDNAQANSSIFTFRVDTTPPSLSIVYPIDYQSFTFQSGININYTSSDSGTGLNSCWYSNNSGAVNHSITCGNNFTISEAGDGTFSTSIWANDSVGNVINKSVHYQISLTAPSVTDKFPYPDGVWLNYKNNIQFNVTGTDSNGLYNCSLWGNWTGIWHLNQTNSTAITSGILYTFYQNLTDGFYKYNFQCFDTINSMGFGVLNFSFGVDTIFPSLSLIHPQNISYTSSILSLNFSTNDANTLSCKYSANGGLANTSIACQNTTYSASQGSTNLILYSSDLAGNTNSSNITFFIDSIIPSVKITSPANATYFSRNTSIPINISISDTNIQTCDYSLDGGANTSFTCGSNLSLNVADELMHYANIHANDTLNNRNDTSTISFFADSKAPVIANLSTNTTGGSQTFSFSYNYTEAFPNSCFYAIYNSSGGVDGANNNLSITCGSDSSATTTAFADYNLTICSTDLAGNLGCSTKSFTTTAGSVVIISGGGGSPTTTIKYLQTIVATNYSLSATNLVNKMDVTLAKNSVRPRNKDFVLINKGKDTFKISIVCDSINLDMNQSKANTPGIDICKYVTISNSNITVSPNEDNPTTGKLSVMVPKNAEFGDIYNFNLLAYASSADNLTISYSKLSVTARVPLSAEFLYKYSSVPFTKGADIERPAYSTSIVALVISLLIFTISLLLLIRNYPLVAVILGFILAILSYILYCIFA